MTSLLPPSRYSRTSTLSLRPVQLMKNPTVSISGVRSTNEWSPKGWVAAGMRVSEGVLDELAELVLRLAQAPEELVVDRVAASASAAATAEGGETGRGAAGRVADLC